MEQDFFLKRTSTADKDFQYLVNCLDHELWVELKEDQATYDQHNKVPDIKTALLIYRDGEPAACGCFKEFDTETVEIKRMFVQKNHRGLGLSKKILRELEAWAIQKKYKQAVLETSIRFKTARQLYESSGYTVIPNYPPYVGLTESVCMKKQLINCETSIV
jgi:GNAT superfamily N-acetyltransferase